MDEQTEVAYIIDAWLLKSAPEWHIDWGTHDKSRPRIVRSTRIDPIGHTISGRKVLPDYRYPGHPVIGRLELDISDPEFFDKLKVILKNCEEIFNY